MNPVISFLKWITGQLTEERKARAEEEKARFYAMQILNDEYREKIREQEEEYQTKIKERDDLIEKLQDGTTIGSLQECIEREIDLNKQIVELLNKVRIARQEAIFLEIELNILKTKYNES